MCWFLGDVRTMKCPSDKNVAVWICKWLMLQLEGRVLWWIGEKMCLEINGTGEWHCTQECSVKLFKAIWVTLDYHFFATCLPCLANSFVNLDLVSWHPVWDILFSHWWIRRRSCASAWFHLTHGLSLAFLFFCFLSALPFLLLRRENPLAVENWTSCSLRRRRRERKEENRREESKKESEAVSILTATDN